MQHSALFICFVFLLPWVAAQQQYIKIADFQGDYTTASQGNNGWYYQYRTSCTLFHYNFIHIKKIKLLAHFQIYRMHYQDVRIITHGYTLVGAVLFSQMHFTQVQQELAEATVIHQFTMFRL